MLAVRNEYGVIAKTALTHGLKGDASMAFPVEYQDMLLVLHIAYAGLKIGGTVLYALHEPQDALISDFTVCPA